MKSKLLTRRQVIGIWNDESDEMKDMFCCPNCRDLLHKEKNTGKLFCSNGYCKNDKKYTV